MRICDLDDNNLRIFLESMPEKSIRDSFKYSKILKSKIKGFRVEKCDINRLINISVDVIKKGQAYEYGKDLDHFFDMYKQGYENAVQGYIKDDYPERFAKAQAMVDSVSEKMRPVFYLLSDFDENEKSELDETISVLSFLNKRYLCKDSGKKGNDIEILENAIQKSLEDTNKRLDEKVKDLQNSVSSCEDRRFDLKNEMNTRINELEKDYSFIEKEINECKKEIIALRKSTNNEKKNRLDELEKKIDLLGEAISNFSRTSQKEWNHLICKTHDLFGGKIAKLNDEDELDDAIYDLFESSNHFKSVRSMIKEIIFSHRPVIAGRKNARIFANKLAMIISGGKLYEVTITDSDYLKELEEFLNTISKENGSVILIKGLFTKANYTDAIDVLHNIGLKNKCVCEIGYPKQLRYMPIELAEDFLFFGGDLDEQFETDAAYVLGMDLVPNYNDELRKVLEELDFSYECSTYTEDISGILGMGIIPFIHYSENAEYEDILSKITNSELRKKCKEIVGNGQS